MANAMFPRHRSSALVTQTVPRSQGRADVPALAINDAGHASGGGASNPILYGLGVTLNFEFNAHVRTFVVQVKRGDILEDITSQLAAVTNSSDSATGSSRRFRLAGQAGVFPLGLSTDTAGDYTATQEIEFLVSMTNIAIARQTVNTLAVVSESDMRHCPEADVCDVPLYGPLNKAGIRIFQNMIDRADPANVPVSFFFDQLDVLATNAPDAIAQLTDYAIASTVGVEFTNDGAACGAVETGATPGCGSLSCCCTIDGRNFSTVPANNTTVGFSTSFTVTVTIPTIGGVDCIGWANLVIGLPGANTTGGFFQYDDTIAAVLTAGGVPVATSPTSGLGHLNGRDLIAAAPIACGADLVLTYNLIAATVTPAGPVTSGFLTFTDTGICNPGGVGVSLPDYTSAGGGEPGAIDPPAGITLTAASASPVHTVALSSYEIS